MTVITKIISGDAGVDCSAWVMPDVSDPRGADTSGRAAGSGLITAKQLEVIQKQAYEEGFAQGHKDGVDAGQTQIQARVRRLEQLMTAFATPFAELDQRVEQELVTLAMAVARQLVRRELKTDPGQIVAVVREALSALPVASQNVRLHLHPEDAALVRAALSLTDGEHAWRIIEDGLQNRGGCQLVTDTSRIDAGVETRLAAIIATVLGGERGDDQ
jgi:flagellar assembly protein FliH